MGRPPMVIQSGLNSYQKDRLSVRTVSKSVNGLISRLILFWGWCKVGFHCMYGIHRYMYKYSRTPLKRPLHCPYECGLLRQVVFGDRFSYIKIEM